MRPLTAAVACWLSMTLAAVVSAQVPEIITGPRPQARVVDETGTLSADERATIERLAISIRDTTKADLVVVVVPTTAGEPHRRFATELFNRWQLGNAARNDGLLLFVALGDRKSEIILGDGLDTPATRASAQRIMDGTMIPHFRAGRPARAILDGATRSVTDIVGVSAEVPAAADVAPVPAATAAELVEKRPEPIIEPLVDQTPAMNPATRRAIDVPVPEAFHPAQPWTPPSFDREPVPPSDPFGAVWLLGGAAAAGAGGIAAVRALYRDRKCPHCSTTMIRLSEGEDDARLERSERLEENLGSVDYDVWTCPVCPGVEKVRWGALFTRYAKCPRCRAVTKSQTISRLRAPTQFSEGLERIDERCLHCGWEKTSERTIPRLPEPTSSSVNWSSGSSSGGFSSSSGGFSSSSSGGHSSGGGASGSW